MCCNLMLFCSSFIVVLMTPTLATLGNTPSVVGPFAQFWMFAAVCASACTQAAPRLLTELGCRCFLAIVWVNATVPETKGRTLEEIETLMLKGYEDIAGKNIGLLHDNIS
jgi:hypothetical protein